MNIPRRYFIKLCRILLGFILIALGVVVAKQSYCLAPWNVLNDGISHTFSVSLGTANIIVGTSILVIDLFLREKLGIGMILNIWLIGVFTDAFMALNRFLSLMPKIESVPLQVLFCMLALTLNAFGIYFYMSARMGAGPRDTIVVFFTKHLPLPVGACKLLLEAVVCFTGWAIGGEVGIGSLIFVLCGGPILQSVFRLFHFDVKAVRNESIVDTCQIMTGHAQPPEQQ
ncbi:MAG: hypothetical protein GXW99_09875 [Clostridiales bacterium]|nr:hypothetical protein [Clostridiales bacterium]